MNLFENYSFKNIRYLFMIAGLLTGLLFIGFTNRSLFHFLAEIVIIIIAGGIFMFAWNSRRFLESGYLFVLGVAFLFVGVIEISHLFVVESAGLSSSFSINNGLQIQLFGRLIESTSFIIAAMFINKKIMPYRLLAGYSLFVFAGLYLTLFGNLPTLCYSANHGMTPFWVISGTIILVLYIISMLLLYYRSSIFRLTSLSLVAGAIAFSFFAEILYIRSPLDNSAAHVVSLLLKVISFYLLYKAIIEAGLVRPLNFLFANIRSNQRALRGKKEFAEKLIDMAQTILLVLDEKGNVITFNPYLENIIGYKLEEVKGKNWISNFVLEDDKKGILRVFQQALDGRVIKELIYPIRIRSGKERQIEWSMRAIQTPERDVTGVLASGQDVTAHLNTKKQLLQYAEQLKTANINKDKFFNIIAHDLRNPLTSILNLGEQLSKDSIISPRPRIKQSADKLLNSVNRLAKLTENLLQWSRLQTGKLEFRPVKVRVTELIEPNLELLAGSAQKKNIAVRTNIPGDMMVFADHTMIDSIIQNLVTNAIKFTNEGGKIEIEAEAQGNFIQIKVTDSGIGMDKEKVNSLFKIENQQVTYGTAGERGTGLGLLLCKELVEKNNGQLLVQSQLNVGTTVLFNLPRAH